MGYVADIAKSLRARDAVFFGGYALYLAFSYMTFHSATVLTSAGPLGYGIEVMFSIGAMGARIVVYLICALVVRRLPKTSNSITALMTIGVAMVGFLVAGMVFQFSSAVSVDMFAPWLLLAGVLLGAGDALITLLWARFSSTLTLRAVYLFVVLCLILPALLIKKPFNVGRIYSVALPLSAAGFLLLPIIWNAAGGIVNAFAQLGAMVAGIILWCMIADSANDTKLPSTLLFGLALACTNAAQLAGTAIGFLNAETLKQGDLVLTTVALVSVYLLLMAALLLFKDKRLASDDDEPAAQLTPEEALASRCDEIAADHQFTPRETEIFKLLAQGYTMPVISEKLFVSENTVKSHVKSIYQKLGIHVRSELIDLVNRP